MLAVDCEGVNMDRRGRLCVVSVATAKTRFVFDVVALGAALFDQGLRYALSCESGIALTRAIRCINHSFP